MESRSRRRLGSRPPRGARRRNNQGADGDGADRISGLHDDLLLLVLTRLRSARNAARTSVLSTRWSDLWRRLPELYFLDRISPSAQKAALAKVAVPKLSVLDIADPYYNSCAIQSYSPADIASLLHTAARLDPLELSIKLWMDAKYPDNAVELPCFARATSVNLQVRNLNLTLPAQGGEFPVLERLSIGSCIINSGVLISRCPYLRVLELNQCQSDDAIIVHSTTIEELHVTSNYNMGTRGVNIVAPVLKKLKLSTVMLKDFTMSLLAPMVESHYWNCNWHKIDVMIDRVRRLARLKLETEESGWIVLRLEISSPLYSVSHKRKLQEIFQFPDFSVLELYLESSEHVYGGMVLNILRIYNGIRRLKIVTSSLWRAVEACPPNCLCDQPQNWRSHNALLLGLEEVEIVHFKGSCHEVDFLKLLFRCAPLTKVIVRLESKVSTRSRGCKEIYNLFKANPSVECNVYQKRGKEVVYA